MQLRTASHQDGAPSEVDALHRMIVQLQRLGTPAVEAPEPVADPVNLRRTGAVQHNAEDGPTTFGFIMADTGTTESKLLLGKELTLSSVTP